MIAPSSRSWARDQGKQPEEAPALAWSLDVRQIAVGWYACGLRAMLGNTYVHQTLQFSETPSFSSGEEKIAREAGYVLSRNVPTCWERVQRSPPVAGSTVLFVNVQKACQASSTVPTHQDF